MIKQQSFKLDDFREKIETLVTENEELRSHRLRDMHSNNELGPSGPLNSELLAELTEKANILMEENSLLIEQKVALSNELDQQHDALEAQRAQLIQLNSATNLLEKEQARLSSLLVQVEKERDEAVSQAVGLSEALGKAESEVDSLSEQLTLAQQQINRSEQTAQELKKQVKLLSSRYNDDASQSVGRVKQAEERVKELHTALVTKNKELELGQEALRKLRSEYKSTRQDAEGMLQVMTGMHARRI
jgi:chromosome segregation ATPase